jgi:Tripartite tricarboxylate transporter family receptor
MQPVAIKVRSAFTAAAAIAASALTAAPAVSQNFPSAGVKLIVPVPAGGVTDTMARLVAQPLTEMWGQPVVVDNRPGGNTGVGAQAVSGAPPDGHTLLVARRRCTTSSWTQARPAGVHSWSFHCRCCRAQSRSRVDSAFFAALTHRSATPNELGRSAGEGAKDGKLSAHPPGCDRARCRQYCQSAHRRTCDQPVRP